MRIFKYRSFCRWAKSEIIKDEMLQVAVAEMNKGLYKANLGAGLYKKRIARKGQGKRGGYRIIIAFKLNDKAIFMYGFAKHERDNLELKETEVYKKLAKYYLDLTDDQLNLLIKNGELFEVVL